MRAASIKQRFLRRRGSSLVEFSLVTLLLTMLLYGVVEMGRMVLVYTTVANAARVGARYAIVHGGDRTGSGVDGPSGPGSTTQVETVVKNFAQAGLVDRANFNITVTYNPDNTVGSRVDVKVVYPYVPIINYFPLTVNLASTSGGIISF